MWPTILVACAAAYATKLTGYLVPARWLSGPRAQRTLTLMPACLLSALVVVQCASTGRALVLDARVAGVAVAALALWLRAPFVLVVVAAVLTAALVRAIAG